MNQQQEEIHLFSNASEFDFWCQKNCNTCAKSYNFNENGLPCCEIESAILDAACGVPMPPEIATRMGCDAKGNWQSRNRCTELEAIL